MASAEQLTLDALKASAALAALVGSGDQLRVYPNVADEGAKTPYVEFERAETESTTYLDFSPSPAKVSIQVMCWADGRALAGEVARAVEDAMRSAYHMQTGGPADYVPDLRAYAEARFFDVWEF